MSDPTLPAPSGLQQTQIFCLVEPKEEVLPCTPASAPSSQHLPAGQKTGQHTALFKPTMPIELYLLSCMPMEKRWMCRWGSYTTAAFLPSQKPWSCAAIPPAVRSDAAVWACLQDDETQRSCNEIKTKASFHPGMPALDEPKMLAVSIHVQMLGASLKQGAWCISPHPHAYIHIHIWALPAKEDKSHIANMPSKWMNIGRCIVSRRQIETALWVQHPIL